MNRLYYGDNLNWLPEIGSESVDLIYLDPPFNSKRAFNAIFRGADGEESAAQVQAFSDYWEWTPSVDKTFSDLIGGRLRGRRTPENLITFVEAIRSLFGDNNMAAYLVMMAARMIEMWRVLKPTGSLYLHCDPTASHYLKVLLDAVFGPDKFVNEIIWQRTNVHSDAKRWSPVSDTLLFYAKSDDFTWNPMHVPHDDEYLASKYRFTDADGRRYRLDNMTSPNPRPNMMYEWKGHASPALGWRYSRETMAKLDSEGRIWYPDSKSKRPQFKRYLDTTKGTILGNVWTDIDPINSRAQERLGYPTQKPLALLERIIEASSNKGDVVLDPFCGCGTAIEAAEKMDRTWIGIDITYLAVPIIRKRLKAYPDASYAIEGAPADQESAQALADADKYQFQWWALDKIGAVPHGVVGTASKEGKKGSDQGIDGVMRFREHATDKSHRVIVSVKAGKNLNPGMVRDLCGTVNNTKATLGVFLCMGEPTKEMRKAATEAGAFSPTGHKGSFPKIQIITVKDIFEGKKVEMPGQDITELESLPEAQLSLFEQKPKRKKPQRVASDAATSEIDLPSKKTSASKLSRAARRAT